MKQSEAMDEVKDVTLDELRDVIEHLEDDQILSVELGEYSDGEKN